MALKLNGTRDYPIRKELVAFGQTCFVKKPEQIIERIADAMQSTLDLHSHLGEPSFIHRIKKEWDAGRMSLAQSHFVKTRYSMKY